MKNEIARLDATPSKRLYLSIIADYDLNRSICELVDNGLDVWVRSGKARNIIIKITLDKAQQIISVEDDAGGLPKSELRYIVGPGLIGFYSIRILPHIRGFVLDKEDGHERCKTK